MSELGKNANADSPSPYFTSFFRLTVVISLSGDGMALSFFLRESVQRREHTALVLTQYKLEMQTAEAKTVHSN